MFFSVGLANSNSSVSFFAALSLLLIDLTSTLGALDGMVRASAANLAISPSTSNGAMDDAPGGFSFFLAGTRTTRQLANVLVLLPPMATRRALLLSLM